VRCFVKPARSCQRRPCWSPRAWPSAAAEATTRVRRAARLIGRSRVRRVWRVARLIRWSRRAGRCRAAICRTPGRRQSDQQLECLEAGNSVGRADRGDRFVRYAERDGDPRHWLRSRWSWRAEESGLTASTIAVRSK